MIRPSDTFSYYLDDKAPEPKPALLCRYGTVGFWMDYDAKLREAWPEDGANIGALAALADTVVCGWHGLGEPYKAGASVSGVLTLDQLAEFLLTVKLFARLSEADRKKSERQLPSHAGSSVEAAAQGA